MKVEEKILNRFDEYIKTAERFNQERKISGGHLVNSEENYWFSDDSPQYIPRITSVNVQNVIQWGMNCLYLFEKIFGEESNYYKKFNDEFKRFSFEDNHKYFSVAFSILKAAKTDFENGYLFDTRTLIEAEVFDDFLEQAEELLRKKYHGASAVITGCVLEDSLRKLCKRKGITVIVQGAKSILVDEATIDPMNVELAKTGIYTKLLQKKINHLADLRNKAAHGKWSEFTVRDVEDMIRDVRRFMEDYFR